MRSSIFSSEITLPRRAFPWVIVLGLLLVIGLEVVLRLQEPRSLLQYGKGLGSYYEVAYTIESVGAAEFSVLGSSRGRECVVMPRVRDELSASLGRPVSVANYSCPSGKADEMLMVAEKLLQSETKPSLILYFVSPQIIRGEKLSMMRREVLGEFPNQYGRESKHLFASWSEQPIWNFRNTLARNYLTFRHRYRIRDFFVSGIRGRRPTSPVQGEYSIWQAYNPKQSLVTRPVSPEHIRAFVNRNLSDDTESYQSEVRVRSLQETVRLCREAGVPIVLVSAPLSEPLMHEFPPDYHASFVATMGRIEEETGVDWVTTEDLGLELGLEDFREQSHLNRRGGEKMTGALIDCVILPVMTAADDDPTSG